MKRFPTLLLALFITLVLPSCLMAGPARKGIFRHVQPDGSTMSLRLVGDEFGHTFTTLDGRPVVIEKNGRARLRTSLEIAELEEGRETLLEESRAQSLRGTSTPFRVTDGIPDYRRKNFPTKGNIHGVVLLVEYADVSFSQDSATIHNLLTARFNGDHYSEDIDYKGWSPYKNDSIAIQATIPGSARDYFRDQSFGQFTPTFDVLGPIRLEGNRAYYGANNRSGSDSNARGMIKEACQIAYDRGLTDFTPYDNDGDGIVDFVFVVYAGNDEAQYGPAECIWAQAWHLLSPLYLGQVSIFEYACSAELCYDANNFIAGIGTFAHEFSHVIGLPDFYNTWQTGTDADFTMDFWSIMDYGMYNGEGYIPAAYTSFERYSLGWLPMETLDEPANCSLEQTDNCRKGYRAFVNEEDTSSFYIFENIQKNNWNSYAPNYGLQITCVNYSQSAWLNNSVNTDRSKHRYHIVPANNDYSYLTANLHLFGRDNHEFGPETTPASITQFGDTLHLSLTDIQRTKNGPVTFRLSDTTNGITQHVAESPREVYTLDGQRIDIGRSSEAQLPKGIYIVCEGGKARKWLVK